MVSCLDEKKVISFHSKKLLFDVNFHYYYFVVEGVKMTNLIFVSMTLVVDQHRHRRRQIFYYYCFDSCGKMKMKEEMMMATELLTSLISQQH